MKLIDKLKAIVKKHDTVEEAVKEMREEELIVSTSEGRRIYGQLKERSK